MKKLVFLFCIFTLISCERDESKDKIITTALNPVGSWSVIKVTSNTIPLVSTFAPNEIKWNFESNSIITVLNTNTNTTKNDVLDSGNYSYFLANYLNTENCNSTIKINNVARGCANIVENTMIIGKSAADGLTIELVKNTN